MMAAIAGGMFALGLLVVLQGLFPKKADLGARLSQFSDQDLNRAAPELSLAQSLAITLLETVKGDKMEEFLADIAVTDSNFEDVAIEKVKAAAAAGCFAGVFCRVFGFISGPTGLLFAFAIGCGVGFLIPDLELKKKATARRVQFSQALTAFITLLGSSIAGGGGITTAMKDAAAMGDGWVFVKLRDALDTAHLNGTSSWLALEKLGRELKVTPLIELSGSLTLAGSSGARVTETLSARAESSRAKELAEARSEAEAKSSKLGMPVGLMLLAWAAFMGYPAVLSLMGLS